MFVKEKSKAKKIVAPDGIDVYYWINRNPNHKNEFIVLHPGSSANHSSLEGLEHGLNERGKSTLMFDPRGAGFSEAPGEPQYFSLNRYSGDLEMIMTQEGIEKPELFGHSFGFMPIVDYLSRTGNGKYIIAMGGSHKFSETTVNRALFHLFNHVLRYGGYINGVINQAVHFLGREKWEYSDQSGLEGASDLVVGSRIADVPFRVIKSHIVSGKEICKWDISNQLRKIRTPILLIYADDDFMVRPAAQDYMKDLVNSELQVEVLPGTHSLPIVSPNAILQTMDKYHL